LELSGRVLGLMIVGLASDNEFFLEVGDVFEVMLEVNGP
jgi:hypothetical protein